MVCNVYIVYVWCIFWVCYDLFIWNKTIFEVNIFTFAGSVMSILFLWVGTFIWKKDETKKQTQKMEYTYMQKPRLNITPEQQTQPQTKTTPYPHTQIITPNTQTEQQTQPQTKTTHTHTQQIITPNTQTEQQTQPQTKTTPYPHTQIITPNTQTEQQTQPQTKTIESKCRHYGGYLKNRDKSEEIPEECLVCEKLIQCS